MNKQLKLKLEEISATYSTGEEILPVLDNISLSLDTGEFVSVLGPSGSGKSTLLKIAAGLLKPERGRILVDGRNVTGLSRLVGYMPQQDLLFPWKTLRQNAALPLISAKLDKKETKARIEELLPVFGLRGFGEYYPDQLSGGMRQRGALMRTMLIESDLLLLDEPFAALDALTRQNLQEWLLKIWGHFRRSVLFITHSIDEAIYLSDRVYVITERPGKNAFEQAIEIPRPRSKSVMTTPQFSLYKKILIEALADNTASKKE